MIDLARLKMLAERLEPLEWRAKCCTKKGEHSACCCANCEPPGEGREPYWSECFADPSADMFLVDGPRVVIDDDFYALAREDAEYIAAVGPKTMLALLREIEELRALVRIQG